MFTGIIEEIGTISKVITKNESMELGIHTKIIASDIKLGDSISVSGVCLTVTSFTNNYFHVDIMPETFNNTSLKYCQVGSKVNLERALPANGRIGGHFVSAHVDSTGTITAITTKDNAIYMNIKINNTSLTQYFTHHGSVAIDGTSLTIFKVEGNNIEVSLIPHTIKNSIVGLKKVGDIVNIECDMLAKFTVNTIQNITKNTKINKDFLYQNGFIG